MFMSIFIYVDVDEIAGQPLLQRAGDGNCRVSDAAGMDDGSHFNSVSRWEIP